MVLAVACTATQNAAEGIQHLSFGGRGHPIQQVGRSHQHPRNADAALCCTFVEEGLLERVEPPILRQAFDGRDRASLHLPDRNHASTDLLAVNEDGAGPTVSGITADFGSGQPQILAQHIGESPDRANSDRNRLTVQSQGNGLLLGCGSLAAGSRWLVGGGGVAVFEGHVSLCSVSLRIARCTKIGTTSFR